MGIKVKLLKDGKDFGKAGEIINIDKIGADSLVEEGYAEYIIDEIKKELEHNFIKECFNKEPKIELAVRNPIRDKIRKAYSEEELKQIMAEIGNLGIHLDYEALIKKPKEKKDMPDIIITSSFVDENEQILGEQIYTEQHKSQFCIYYHKTGKIEYKDEFLHAGKRYIPHEGEELEKGAVLLPSKAEDYTEEQLDSELKDFINQWLDIPDKMMQFAIWNSKKSFVYQQFNNTNYLRCLGDFGTGKSRFLNVLGNIHYKPVFTNGTASPAALFRIIDKWKGTLVMDEADFNKSDESQEVIKIINQGFEKGNFIIRCNAEDTSKVDFFEPYCPKILATRGNFQDKATESRCFTDVMKATERKDIPSELNAEFYQQGLHLRNKLLLWRFKNYFNINKACSFDGLEDLEPRIKQIVSSYIVLFSKNKEQFAKFKEFVLNYQIDLISERQNSLAGIFLEGLHSLLEEGQKDIIVSDVIKKAELLDERTGELMAPRRITAILKYLGFGSLKPIKIKNKTFKLIPIKKEHLEQIFKRYGLSSLPDKSYQVTQVTEDTESTTPRADNALNAYNKIIGAPGNLGNFGNSVTEEPYKIDLNPIKIK